MCIVVVAGELEDEEDDIDEEGQQYLEQLNTYKSVSNHQIDLFHVSQIMPQFTWVPILEWCEIYSVLAMFVYLTKMMYWYTFVM